MICGAFLQQNEAVQLQSAYAAVAAITEQHPIMVISSAGPGQPGKILGFSMNRRRKALSFLFLAASEWNVSVQECIFMHPGTCRLVQQMG